MKTLLLLPAFLIATTLHAQRKINIGLEGGPGVTCMRDGNVTASSFNIGYSGGAFSNTTLRNGFL